MRGSGRDGNSGRERLKLKSHRYLRKSGTLRKGTCLEGVWLRLCYCGKETNWRVCQHILEGIMCHAQGTWTLSCQHYPIEFSMMMEMLCFLPSNMVATSLI